jgi:transcription initiation factor TFIIB
MKRSKREALVEGLETMDSLVDELDLGGEVRQRATEIYRDAIEEGTILPGQGVERIVAACVLLATRESPSVTEADDIEPLVAGHIDDSALLRTSKKLRNKLDLGFLLADPHKYVDEIADGLDASDDDRDRVHTLTSRLIENGGTSGKKAAAVAGSLFYLVGVLSPVNGSNGKYTQTEIAEMADVSEVTIRNSYRDFGRALDSDPQCDLSITGGRLES